MTWGGFAESQGASGKSGWTGATDALGQDGVHLAAFLSGHSPADAGASRSFFERSLYGNQSHDLQSRCRARRHGSHVYSDHSLTIARHPSETDERLLIRILAFALNLPESDDNGTFEFAKDMWEPDEPCLWQKDLTGVDPALARSGAAG